MKTKLLIIPLLLIFSLTGCSLNQANKQDIAKENRNDATELKRPEIKIPDERQSQELLDHLYQNVPEIEEINNRIMTYAEADVRVTMYIEEEPNYLSEDEYERDYYRIYVGEDHQGTRQVNVYRFLIHKDTKEILAIDPVTFEPMSLEEWRANK